MFGSFFDLKKIEQLCQSYGLRSHQHMIRCPGLKEASLAGAMIKHPALCNSDGSLNKRKKLLLRSKTFILFMTQDFVEG
ncbi:hypothetical protein PS15m_009927 [Mucor circinelloides]